MNCVIYARVSTEEQAELSIPAQAQAMLEYANRQGWNVIDQFIEPGVSGRSMERRTALQAMLKRCREVPKIDVVLVHKIDRLARSVLDHATIRFMLQQRAIRLASVVENVDDSVSGQLLENIMASIAQFYSANLGEEVKKGMRMLVQRGGWPHKPTRGYRLTRDASGNSRIERDEPAASAIQSAFEEYAEGWSTVDQMSKDLAKSGVTNRRGEPIPTASLQHMFKNRFYIGRVSWKGVEHAGLHPALVSETVFERVQQVLREHHHIRTERLYPHQYLLRRFAQCSDCGARMTAEHHARGSYYRCARNTKGKALCRAPFSNTITAHRNLDAVYGQLRLTDDTRQQLLAAAERLINARFHNAKSHMASLAMRRAKLEERELKLTEGYASGDVSLRAYRASTATIHQQLAAIDAAASEAKSNPAILMRKVTEVMATIASLYDMHRSLNDMRRFILLRIVFRSIILERGEIVAYKLQHPLDKLFASSASGSSHDDSSRSPVAQKQVESTIMVILEHDWSPLLSLHTDQLTESATDAA